MIENKSRLILSLSESAALLFVLYGGLPFTFKTAINTMGTKHLFAWIDEVRTLSIEESDSFLRGLEQDIKAVENAVIFNFNNGLAEGFANKLKVIKRIMFGRCSFELLRKKVIKWINGSISTNLLKEPF